MGRAEARRLLRGEGGVPARVEGGVRPRGLFDGAREARRLRLGEDI